MRPVGPHVNGLDDDWVNVPQSGSHAVPAKAPAASLNGDVLAPAVADAAMEAHMQVRDSSLRLQRVIKNAPSEAGLPDDLHSETQKHEAAAMSLVNAYRVISPEAVESVVGSLKSDMNDAAATAEREIERKVADPAIEPQERTRLELIKAEIATWRGRLNTFYDELRGHLRHSKIAAILKDKSILTNPWFVASLSAVGTFALLAIVGMISQANQKKHPKIFVLPRQPVMPPPQQPVILRPMSAPLPPPPPRASAPQPIILMFPNINTNARNSQN